MDHNRALSLMYEYCYIHVGHNIVIMHVAVVPCLATVLLASHEASREHTDMLCALVAGRSESAH